MAVVPTLPVAVRRSFQDTDAMFLRAKARIKDGKAHRYWSIVENRRTRGNRVVQRQVLYLGEINDSQETQWCKTIEVFQGDESRSRQLAIFPRIGSRPRLNVRWYRSNSMG